MLEVDEIPDSVLDDASLWRLQLRRPNYGCRAISCGCGDTWVYNTADNVLYTLNAHPATGWNARDVTGDAINAVRHVYSLLHASRMTPGDVAAAERAAAARNRLCPLSASSGQVVAPEWLRKSLGRDPLVWDTAAVRRAAVRELISATCDSKVCWRVVEEGATPEALVDQLTAQATGRLRYIRDVCRLAAVVAWCMVCAAERLAPLTPATPMRHHLNEGRGLEDAALALLCVSWWQPQQKPLAEGAREDTALPLAVTYTSNGTAAAYRAAAKWPQDVAGYGWLRAPVDIRATCSLADALSRLARVVLLPAMPAEPDGIAHWAIEALWLPPHTLMDSTGALAMGSQCNAWFDAHRLSTASEQWQVAVNTASTCCMKLFPWVPALLRSAGLACVELSTAAVASAAVAMSDNRAGDSDSDGNSYDGYEDDIRIPSDARCCPVPLRCARIGGHVEASGKGGCSNGMAVEWTLVHCDWALTVALRQACAAMGLLHGEGIEQRDATARVASLAHCALAVDEGHDRERFVKKALVPKVNEYEAANLRARIAYTAHGLVQTAHAHDNTGLLRSPALRNATYRLVRGAVLALHEVSVKEDEGELATTKRQRDAEEQPPEWCAKFAAAFASLGADTVGHLLPCLLRLL